MGEVIPSKPVTKPDTRWHASIIPLYMAIGNPGIIVTLVALSLGASVAEIGAMTATAAAATFVFSTAWGRFSDNSGSRKKFLLFFSVALCPIFLALGMAVTVPQLVVAYTALAGISAGVAPIGVMYTVECCKGRNWQGGVAKFNSLMSVGNIIGLIAYTTMTQFYATRILFYIAAAMCIVAAIMLWRMGNEPEITLERHPFSARSLHFVESLLSPRPFLNHMDIRKIRLPRSLKQLTPLQLLLLAAFVHWTGINFYVLGQAPLMKTLGLSDSSILALSVGNGVAAAAAFAWIAPRIKSDHKRLLKRFVAARVAMILVWAAFPLFLLHPVSYVYIFPILISAIFNVFYALIWLPISNFAISQASEDHRGSVMGQLLSATGIANVVGSALGGLIFTAYGYSVGFIVAAIIALLMIPIISRIETFELN